MRRSSLAAGLLLACGALLHLAADPPKFPDLSSYPQNDTLFTRWVLPHTNPAAVRHRWTNLMIISVFRPDMTLEYFTGEKGENYSHRNTGIALQNTKGQELTAPQLTRLREALRELPKTNSTPPLERLVLLSHREGTNWVTRSFDNGGRPKALQTLFQIIGERPE